MYEDVMDPNRFISPVSTDGKETLCKVYYQEKGRPQYYGKAKVPTKLLGDYDHGFTKVSG